MQKKKKGYIYKENLNIIHLPFAQVVFHSRGHKWYTMNEGALTFQEIESLMLYLY